MCAPGLAWESLLRLCMSAQLVGCQSSKSFEPLSGIRNFFSNEFLFCIHQDCLSKGSSKRKWLHLFTRPVIKTTTTTMTTTTTTTSTVPVGLPSVFSCAGRANGYYPDPVHCHKFHYCATGIEQKSFNFYFINHFLFRLA